MAAIAGCVGEADVRNERACASMLDALHIYGPKARSSKTWAGASFGIALSDPAPTPNGGGPLVGGDRFFLVADIRLDNREALSRDLDLRQSGPRSDAEILLDAWMRWGAECVDRIRGDFAFAMFDRRDRTLSLVRDPTGQRPLFYAGRGAILAFASMPSALLACGLARPSFRFDRLAEMIARVPRVGDKSYFEDVFRVQPGHLVVLSNGIASTRRYWVPPRHFLRLSESEYVEAYHERLEAAVRPRLIRASGLVGVHLSSGYDSSAVAAEAARLSGDSPPLAFTSAPRADFSGPVPRGRIGDESELAALTAQMHGMRHVVIRPADGVLSKLREHGRLYQEPDRDIVNMEWWSAILRAARELGVSTLLTGQLGNLSIHAGGLPTLAEWVRRGSWIRWWNEASAAARRPDVSWRGVMINSFGEWVPAPVAQALSRAYLGAPSPADQSFLRGHWLRKAQARAAKPVREDGIPYRDRLALLRLQDPGLFRMGAVAEAGIDERDPTADRDLIDFSFTLPPEELLHDGVWRPLARRALAGRLPQRVLDSPLRGYQGGDWFERLHKSEARAVLEEISTSSAVAELLDLKKIERAIDDWPEGPSASLGVTTIYRNRLPVALSTGVFLQEFESAPASSIV